LIVGVVFGIIAVILAFFRPEQFFRRLPCLDSCAGLGVALGSMRILHDPSSDRRRLGHGHPAHSGRRDANGAAAGAPVYPVIFGIHRLYIWAQPLDQVVDKHLREHLENITKTYLTRTDSSSARCFYFAI